MKQYLSNYLGIVISNDVPEGRGRCQVYIPHVMPTINRNLLRTFGIQGETLISFNAVGSNIAGGLPATAIETLKKMLPWAEPALPLLGNVSPGHIMANGDYNQGAVGNTSTDPDKSALVPGNSGPVAQPTTNTPTTTTTAASGAAPSAVLTSGASTNIIPAGEGTNCLSSISDNMIKYVSSIAATESGLTSSSGAAAYNEALSNVTNTTINTKGAIPDYGYFQTNVTDGMQNYGSACEQTLSVVNWLKTNAPVAAAMIEAGQFDECDLNGRSGASGTGGRIIGHYPSGSKNSGKWFGPGDSQSLARKIRNTDANTLRGKIAAAPTIDKGDVTAALAGAKVKMQTPPGNQTHTTTIKTAVAHDTTNLPKGAFSQPSVGALVWCFFREGNPLFPVYFAAAFRGNEFSGAFNGSSPGPGNDPSKTGDDTYNRTVIASNKGGVIDFSEAKDNHGLKISGYSGGHVHFAQDHTMLYAPDDFYNQVDGHKFDVVLSNRETQTRGDSNTVIMGDYFIKVGDVTSAANHDVINNIKSMISQINEPMLKA